MLVFLSRDVTLADYMISSTRGNMLGDNVVPTALCHCQKGTEQRGKFCEKYEIKYHLKKLFNSLLFKYIIEQATNKDKKRFIGLWPHNYI